MSYKTAAIITLASGILIGTLRLASADGAAVYGKCKGCHGTDGKGNAALKIAPFDASKPEAALKAVIADGKGKMPAYKGKLSDAEIDEVTKHIKTLK